MVVAGVELEVVCVGVELVCCGSGDLSCLKIFLSLSIMNVRGFDRRYAGNNVNEGWASRMRKSKWR